MGKATTLGELKASGYRPTPVKAELRRNLIARLRRGERLFPGVIGYDETVIPQLANAILGGQDIMLLGERGQAKSRIVRGLTALLDDEIPIIAGTDIPEDPLRPITARGRAVVAESGDDTPIAWLPRDERYGEKLATPDITIADLIGEVDPIKVAEGRYLDDELTLHFGLLPRVNRGIFAVNELPDLAERIQVGLLNVLEERDVQIRGHKVRLPLDVMLIATANPEDYTNRGRIITPLKDRYGAQIRTHYPAHLADEIDIMEQEAAALDMGDYRVAVPPWMKEIVAEITHQARRSPDVNQRSGVSVRASVANYEALLANAFRRALRLSEKDVVPRISDLPFLMPSLQGKVEFEAMEDGQEDRIADGLIAAAVKAVFERHLNVDDLEDVVLAFGDGTEVETGEDASQAQYEVIAKRIPGLDAAFEALSKITADEKVFLPTDGWLLPAAIEFVLEGLHLNKLLNKASTFAGRARYSG